MFNVLCHEIYKTALSCKEDWHIGKALVICARVQSELVMLMEWLSTYHTLFINIIKYKLAHQKLKLPLLLFIRSLNQSNFQKHSKKFCWQLWIESWKKKLINRYMELHFVLMKGFSTLSGCWSLNTH